MKRLLSNFVYMVKRMKDFSGWLIFSIVAEVILALGLSYTGLLLTQKLVNLVSTDAEPHLLITWLVLLIGGYSLLQIIANYVRTKNLTLAQMFRVQMLSESASVLLYADYQLLTDKQFGETKEKAIMASQSNDSTTQSFPLNLRRFFEQILKIGTFGAMLSILDLRLLGLIAVMLIVVIAYRIFQHKFIKETKQERSRYNDQYRYIDRVTANFRLAKDIRIFRVSPWFVSIFDSVFKNLRHLTFRRGRVVLIGQFLSALGIATLTFFGYFVLIRQLVEGSIDLGQLMFYIGAITTIAVSSTELINVIFDLFDNSEDITNLRKFFQYPNIFNHEAKEPIPTHIETIELIDVSFRYPESQEPIIDHMNLTIRRDEKLALVGLNGAGKTTLVKLICNLYKPDSGKILINGIDNQAFDVKDYYELFSVVFQEHFTLPETIQHAIVQSNPFDGVRYQKVLEQSGMTPVISALAKGDQTELVKEVSSDAITLSGGQLQKLKLAQALYKNGQVLILDEPTAALDPLAESEVYRQYHQHAEDKLSLFISHRLATTQFCDRILYLDKGNILEDGSHKELVELQGKYAQMYEKQAYYYQEGVRI